jgi:hypothetical protein
MEIYTHIYNTLTKYMGIVELEFVRQININDIIFNDKEYAFGPYTYAIYGRFGRGINLKLFTTNDVLDINHMPNYCRVVINKKGEMFKTPVIHKKIYIDLDDSLEKMKKKNYFGIF